MFNMIIHGLEKLSLVDYDGCVAATVFTGNCNFRCGFCHNSALVLGAKDLPVIPENEILDYLTKRKGILDGLCITGGEPTLNKDLALFMEKVKKIGYKVKLDTNGTAPETVKMLTKNGLCDYFAIDIKNDKENYAKTIGLNKFDISNVEKTVEFLLKGLIPYEFRTTIIAEYHTAETIKNIGDWIAGAEKYFMQKFKSGENCISQGLTAVPKETAETFLREISGKVKYCSLRGYD